MRRVECEFVKRDGMVGEMNLWEEVRERVVNVVAKGSDKDEKSRWWG